MAPLSSFASKIDIAFAFSIIDDETFADLKVIRELRNAFAHPHPHLELKAPRLDEPYLVKIAAKFSGYKKDVHPALQFIERSANCLEALAVGPDKDDIMKFVAGLRGINPPARKP